MERRVPRVGGLQVGENVKGRIKKGISYKEKNPKWITIPPFSDTGDTMKLGQTRKKKF